MKVEPIKTQRINPGEIFLFDLLDEHIEDLSENSIVAITSKVVALCEGNVFPIEGNDKEDLVKKEADQYIPKEENRYGIIVTIKDSILACSAGIDESNAGGYYVLWPKDSQKTANETREYLQKRFKIKNVGVIITDSKTTPLRWGVTGIGIAHSGFEALNNLIGTPDLFGRNMKMTEVAIFDGLAASAALVMGEGTEQTPLAVISDVPFVRFQDRAPTAEEIDRLKIDIEDDVYGTMLRSTPWSKGKK